MATLSETRSTVLAARAVERVRRLLTVLDREHTTEELYHNLRGVRHELDTITRLLPGDIQHARNTTTSAHRARRTTRNTQGHGVLATLAAWGGQGATVRLLAEKVGCTLPTARTRLNELVAAELAEPRGRTKDLVTNRKVNTWVVTEAGRKRLAKLDQEQLPIWVETEKTPPDHAPEGSPHLERTATR